MVRLDCLTHALDNREEYGVWGAMTERERRALLRRRPATTSWAEIFKEDRTHQDTVLLSGHQPAGRSHAVPSRTHTGAATDGGAARA